MAKFNVTFEDSKEEMQTVTVEADDRDAAADIVFDEQDVPNGIDRIEEADDE